MENVFTEACDSPFAEITKDRGEVYIDTYWDKQRDRGAIRLLLYMTTKLYNV